MIAYYNNSLYVAAGIDELNQHQWTDLYRFDINTQTWEHLGDELYVGSILSAMIVYNDALYMFFGWSVTNQDDLDLVQFANLSSPTNWTAIDFNEYNIDGRDSFAYALVDHIFYLFGGFSLDSNKNSQIMNLSLIHI